MNNNTLDPDLERRYQQLVEAGTARSTRRAYARDVRYFWIWAKLALNVEPHYPVAVDTVVRFVLDHVDAMPPALEQQLLDCGARRRTGRLRMKTLKRYLASLSVAHQEHGVPSPTHDTKVKLLLRRAARIVQQPPANQRAAITHDILVKLLATCDDSLYGVRDRAILLVGFVSGGRRQSELVNLEACDLQRDGDTYLLDVRRSKTDQACKGFTVAVRGEAAKALLAWLVRSGIRVDKVFRGIKSNGKLTNRLTGQSILKMVRRRLTKAGYNPCSLGAHSLRSGFITEAGRLGIHVKGVMSLSGHRDLDTAQEYFRSGDLVRNPATAILDESLIR